MSSIGNCAKGTRNKHFNDRSSTPESRKVDITKEEFARIRDALDNEEFRKLFFDYVQEIQNPENRKIYEEEIKQFEKERGVDVTFIHPQPGFVIKSSIDGEQKCFVNVASCPEVAPPKHETALNPKTGTRGLSWSIPLAQAPPRDDMDAKGQRCKVYDVIFHPDALHLAKRNDDFRKCLTDTALNAVEREFHVKLDHTNLKFPKLDYKGIAQPTVIRKLAANATAEQQEPHPLDHVSPAKPSADSHKPKVLPLKMQAASIPAFATPKYVIKHSHGVDLAEYTHELDAKLNMTVPRALIVEIELPLLKSSAECQLNVTSKSVYLLSERAGAKYQLKVQLPYEVDDKAGNARFDADQRRLCITLPVLRSNPEQEREQHDLLRNYSREDSGVELHSNSASPIEEVGEAEGGEQQDEIDVSVAGETDTAAAVQMDAITPPPTTFLKDSIHYQFPTKFNCGLLDNVMSFVLQVRNVKPDSIHMLQRLNSVHLQFASLGTGYYPTYYAFFIQLPHEQSLIKAAEAEAWENNLVLNLTLNGTSEQLEYYHVGLHDCKLEKYKVLSATNVNTNKEYKEAAAAAAIAGASKKSTSDRVNQAAGVKNAVINDEDDDDDYDRNEAEDDEATTSEPEPELGRKKQNKKQRKRNKPRRSLSESACDELKAMELLQQQPKRQPSKTVEGSSPESNGLSSAVMTMPQRKHRSYSECHDNNGFSTSAAKGILKRYSRYGPRPSISDSCSSIDDCNTTPSYSRSIDASVNGFSQSFDGIPEDAELGLSESGKKTVRFNDHIMKQVFRLDSSILGQRKKNQKRRDCKIRAQQRRLSEGDSADYEDDNNHKPANSEQYLKNKGGDEIGDGGQKCSQHDSGLDLATAVGGSNNENIKQKQYPGKKNKKHEQQFFDSDTEFSGNAMIFDMDDDM